LDYELWIEEEEFAHELHEFARKENEGCLLFRLWPIQHPALSLD